MLDFGWPELLIIIIVAVFVIGPKEIPQIMYGLGRVVRRLQYLKFALVKQFDDFMDGVDIEEMRTGADVNILNTQDTDERAADEQS